MSTVPQVSEAMQWVLNEYPRVIERKTGFVQRSTAILDGVTFVRGLVLGWMAEPEASYSQLRSCLATLGADVTSQALETNLGQSKCAFKKAPLSQGVKQATVPDIVELDLFAGFMGV